MRNSECRGLRMAPAFLLVEAALVGLGAVSLGGAGGEVVVHHAGGVGVFAVSMAASVVGDGS